MAETGWSGLHDGEHTKARRDLKDHIVYSRTNAGSPNGSLTPAYVGELVFDTTNKVLWRALDATNASWIVDMGMYDTSGGAITSVVPGTGATNLGKAVDAVAGASDVGVAALTVRKDAPAALTPVDGDYTRLFVDKWGRLHVRESLDEYETVAASQTAQALGATGATGDIISHVTIIPATLNPGAVTLLDNAISIPLFVGGTASVVTLHPFNVILRMRSVSGAWKITTGADVSVIAVGDFT